MSQQNTPSDQTLANNVLWVLDAATQQRVPLEIQVENGGGIPVSFPSWFKTDFDAITADVDAIATDVDTIATQTTTIATQTTTIATQTTAINGKLPTLDAKNRFKVSDIPTFAVGTLTRLGTSATSIYVASASVQLRLLIANVSAAARTFQIGTANPLTDATSYVKSVPLSVGEVQEITLYEVPSGTTIYGLCDSANGVNVTPYAGAM